jgi:hypothetical protein
MKIKILIGSIYPDKDGKEKGVKQEKICEVPEKIAKSLIKNKAAVKFDSKMIKRKRNKCQHLIMVKMLLYY